MPQLSTVNVRLSGIYGRKNFVTPLPDGSSVAITSIDVKATTGSLREVFESGAFSYEEQPAISYWITGSIIRPVFEQALAYLIRRYAIALTSCREVARTVSDSRRA